MTDIHDTEINETQNLRWLGLSAVLAATIMNLLDSTVVNVAAPVIQSDIGGSYSSIQWIAASYPLALAVGLLTGGRLGDMYGRRRMLLLGVVGFVVASLLCAVAWSPAALIGARLLQGVFGAAMIPQGFGLIRDMFPRQDITKAFAVFGPAIGLATILGPIVAGLLIRADLFGSGWRMVFGINLPIGVYALVAGLRSLPLGERSAARLRLDVPGVLMAGSGMLLLVYPLVQGRELGWPVSSFVLLAAAVAVLGVFGVYQLGRTRAGRTPLVELSVFAKRSYSSGVVFVIVFFGTVVGFSLAVGLFLQLGLGYSPVGAALIMAAWAVGAFLGTGVGATQGARLGRKVLHVGLVLMTLGLAATYAVLSDVGVEVSGRHLALPLLVYGAGMGMIFAPLFDIIMAEIADHEVGSAAGMLESIQQLAGSLGVATLGTVFFAIVGVQASAATFLDASRIVTLISLGLSVVAFGVGFLLPHHARHAALEIQSPAEPEPAIV